MQAIANTAGFHFAFIEQGGASLYPTLIFKATDLEVLRILVSIGGVEIDHFGLWHDKAGNAVAQPLAGVVDPETGLTFPDLNALNSELDQTNLILPEPCEFISKSLPALLCDSTHVRRKKEEPWPRSRLSRMTSCSLVNRRRSLTLVNKLAVEADSVRRGL